MKIVIIGNNVAGTFSAQNIRNLNDNVDIEIYTEEKYPYYSRIKLPEFISGKISIDDLIVYNDDWYELRNLKLCLNTRVNIINPEEKKIILKDEKEHLSYDKLILALGSTPNIPPIKNAIEMRNNKKGVFTLRNIDNALEIKNYIDNPEIKKAIIIGGGLLGLELANQINNCKLDTTVVEFFPQLLPRQLDEECGIMLKEEIENRGITVVLNAVTEEILGNGKVTGIKLKGGQQFNADIILIQAGITPTIDLAKEANIQTNKGIVVNEFLETSIEDIYAVGDCIEYNEKIWGIIPACMEQSKIVASSILGKKKVKYSGTTPKNTLKIMGLDLTSIGVINPSKETGGGWDILKKADKKDCCYEKLVLKDNHLKGAILFGETKALPFIYSNMEQNVSKEDLKELLQLYTYECQKCGAKYDEASQEKLFKDLPNDWKCNCGASKDKFKRLE
ncbi:MAG: FAD-dependent oxidoreductase [Promethearchaeota archaeon]